MAAVGSLAVSGIGVTLLSSMAPSGASRANIRPIVCTAASQLTASSPIIVSGCNRGRITGGSGSLEGNGPYTLTWESGDTFTFSKDSVVTPPSRCPSGTAEVDFRGTVLTDSGFRAHRFIGKSVAYDACLSVGLTVIVVELVPGTQFTIG
jgi:hypothetical protein